jgi:lipopolysaccharide/colanic/teichoic acid biosynthesis glycosyltransferase
MFLITVAVLAEGGRPIFFSQVRLGRRGRHFRMYKFRKFHATAYPKGCSLTLQDDPRLTCVGGFLARAKLDELPQLWNVLKGDMSIVGPRPESLDFQDCFEGPYRLVLEHKPGIFGPSQVLFRNECAFYRGRPDPEQFYRDVLFPLKAQIDLGYFAHRTLLRDLWWAVQGALAVFGWSSLRLQGTILVEEPEAWVREGRAVGVFPLRPGRVPASTAGASLRSCRKAARRSGAAPAGFVPALDPERRCGADQFRVSKDGTASNA